MNTTPENIREQLTEEIAILMSVEPNAVRPDTELHDLGMDSMRFVELLVFIEKQFGLKLIETGLKKEDFRTVSALSQKIHGELRS